MNKKYGISLITLVITIIVIIILAGAVILSLSNSNPLNSANKAVFKSNLSEYNSELELWTIDKYGKGMGIFDPESVNANNSDIKYEGLNIQDIIKSMSDTDAKKFVIENGVLKYNVNGEGATEQEAEWANSDYEGEQPPEETYADATIVKNDGDNISANEPLTVNSTINGENPTYNNPVIPAGFLAVNTSTRWDNISVDYNNGLVIQDAYGNQFVWVPVNQNSVQFAKWCTTNVPYNSTKIVDDTTIPTNEISASVGKYKGFYIARYEAAFNYNNGDIRVASKSSSSVPYDNWSTTRTLTFDNALWNYIKYDDARLYSSQMAQKYGHTAVGTNIVTGIEWDTIMKWLQTSGINVEDSRSWGNYNDSITPADIPEYGNIQISGFSQNWKAKNIYDLAGNAQEWSSEIYNQNDTTSYYIARGGVFNDLGSDYPAADRWVGIQNNPYVALSFRPAMYVK